jgi:hypothetical protein
VSEQQLVREGFVEGFTMGGRIELRLGPDAAESDQMTHAGRLAGHITASQGAKEVQPLYFHYAAGLVMAPAQHELRELSEDGLLNAHRFACARAERRVAITEMQEHDVFCWLLDQADVLSTPELLARMRSMRPGRQEAVARRLARQALDRDE